MNWYEYKTPDRFSNLLMTEEGGLLTGLWFKRDGYVTELLPGVQKITPVLEQTSEWLEQYFKGTIPTDTPPYTLHGLSAFRLAVTDAMLDIGYGKTMTYGDIARELQSKLGSRMSAQAVGGAVGRNPISIIIPCHRVMGSRGKMTGYGGGLKNKLHLLKL